MDPGLLELRYADDLYIIRKEGRREGYMYM